MPTALLPAVHEPARAAAAAAPIRVGFLANAYMDPRKVGSWSGIPFHFAQCLREAGCEIVPVYDLQEANRLGRRAKQAYWKFLRGKRYLPDIDPTLLKSYARQIEARLPSLDVDVLFSPSSRLLAELDTDVPTVFWTGATFAEMLGYYDDFTNLAPSSLREGEAAERAALERCALAVYASDWGAQSAIRDYGAAPAKVRVISYGANLERGLDADEVETVIAARSTSECRLLFVGVDWKRKGAEIAIDAAAELNARGVPTRLSIVGCHPPKDRAPLPPFVEVVGFLKKSVPEERQRLETLYRDSHFFFVPTRAEAFGVVFCEASAFALPSVATATGGIPTAVRDGVNGQLFGLDARGAEYAGWLAQMWADPARYRALAASAFREYEQRLCWPRAGESLAEALREMLENRRK